MDALIMNLSPYSLNSLVPARLQTSSANVDFLSRSDILCSNISVGSLDHLL